MQPAADRADRTLACLGDFFVRKSFDLLENQHRPMLERQLLQSLPDKPLTFLNFHGMGGMIVASLVDWFVSRRGLYVFHRCDHPSLFPFFGDGNVKGDAEQPGIKRGLTLKRRQSVEGLNEGGLGGFLCGVRRPEHLNERVVQAVLVTCDENAERFRPPL